MFNESKKNGNNVEAKTNTKDKEFDTIPIEFINFPTKKKTELIDQSVCAHLVGFNI